MQAFIFIMKKDNSLSHHIKWADSPLDFINDNVICTLTVQEFSTITKNPMVKVMDLVSKKLLPTCLTEEIVRYANAHASIVD